MFFKRADLASPHLQPEETSLVDDDKAEVAYPLERHLQLMFIYIVCDKKKKKKMSVCVYDHTETMRGQGVLPQGMK